MGTFGGHALPGSFFIIFGLWWTVQTYRRYYRSVVKGGVTFRATPTFLCDFLPCSVKRLQWEGILKVFFTTVGFTLEIITAFKDGKFQHYGNGQHATMFFFFGLSGVIDLLVHHHPTLLPEGVEYMIGTLSFSVEGILFAFHTHGRTPLDVLIHTLLVYAIALCVVCSLIELRYRNNVLVPLCRSYAVMLQGTWFWQAGFILYNPIKTAQKWDGENHEHMMIVTMMFAWHMAAIFIFILIIGFIVQLSQRGCGSGSGTRLNSRRYDQVRLISVSESPRPLEGPRPLESTSLEEIDLNKNHVTAVGTSLSDGSRRNAGRDVGDDDDFDYDDSDTDNMIRRSDIVNVVT